MSSKNAFYSIKSREVSQWNFVYLMSRPSGRLGVMSSPLSSSDATVPSLVPNTLLLMRTSSGLAQALSRP